MKNDLRSLPPLHTRKQRNENKHSRMQGKRSKVKNIACQECKRKENRLTPVKLESKKHEKKKVVAEREGSTCKFPSNYVIPFIKINRFILNS